LGKGKQRGHHLTKHHVTLKDVPELWKESGPQEGSPQEDSPQQDRSQSTGRGKRAERIQDLKVFKLPPVQRKKNNNRLESGGKDTRWIPALGMRE